MKDRMKDYEDGFSIPENYFKDLEIRLKSTKSFHFEGFETPDQYFDKLQNKLSNKNLSSQSIRFKFSSKIMGIAASLLFLVAVSLQFFSNKNGVEEDLEVVYIDYFIENIDLITEEDIINITEETIDVDDNILYHYLESESVIADDFYDLI